MQAIPHPEYDVKKSDLPQKIFIDGTCVLLQAVTHPRYDMDRVFYQRKYT